MIPRWFQMFWLSFLSISWIGFGWLSTHQSDSPHLFHRYSWEYFLFLAAICGGNIGLSLFLQQPVYRHRHTIMLVLASICVAFIGAEVFCRTADPLGISYFHETRRYNLDRVSDPDLIFRHRRSWQATYQGVDVRFNELGLRDDPLAPKTPSEYRILVLGDSVVFGWGVAREALLSVQLQQILSTELKRPLRVVNAGVAGYNTVQEEVFLRREGLALHPDLVLLLYHPNDIESTPATHDSVTAESLRHKSPPQVLHLLLEKSWLYRLTLYAGRYGRYGVRSAADLDTHQFREHQGWQDSMNSLREIAKLCSARHIPFVVFYVRLLDTPYNDALLTDVRATVAPVPVADMRSWFVAEDKRVYMNSRMDPHFNAHGHRITAEHMAHYLRHEAAPQLTLPFSSMRPSSMGR